MTTAPPAVKRLVILAPNWLGDAVMALPAIDDVRHAWPATDITMAARPSVAPLFELVGGTKVLTLAAGRSRERAVAELHGRAFDVALLFPNSFGSAFAVWRAGVPQRWGYRSDCRGSLLTRAPARPTRPIHQAAYYQHLTGALGFPSRPAAPQLTLPPIARTAAETKLRATGWDGGPFVVLAPGAAYGGAKRWPAGSFAELADGLAADGIASVLVGSPADAPAGREVLQRIARARAVNLIGQTDLSTLAGVLSLGRGIVTNDSGAMHLAAALGIRVTAMFGPTDDRATYPLGRDHVVLTHDTWCRPCMLRECPLNHQCMRGIAVGDVLAAARRTL